MATVLLVRHGRTSANAGGLLAGWSSGVELDDTGRSQAEALAARLRDLSLVALVSSPLTRCLQTSDVLLRGRPPVSRTECDDLGECRYGAWTGRPLADLAGEPLWQTVQRQPSAATFPPSEEYRHESLSEMSARAVAAVRRHDAAIEAEHGPGALWVAVSHGDVIKAVLADAAGTHLDLFQRFTVGPASLSVVRYTAERPYVSRVNDTGADLAGLVPPPAADAATTDAPGTTGTAGVVGGGA
ncbi:MSMEG_4193 family putative phosphomutase [Mobilicoccus pelagius]|uniref:Phosphoglycerate mutase family protein n=1 Tax=Mobilicoccus pelagius NBRC 104925 TaxID=1089455 RepID=H5UTH6_9MICO|nr:MSMEG_4193 family putative phosphomutase [Mobilicoccus pelagius]GAB49034.1 phosphoglycerate mutase family protein [Mobilicoccus pelagius NBRC 104925]